MNRSLVRVSVAMECSWGLLFCTARPLMLFRLKQLFAGSAPPQENSTDGLGHREHDGTRNLESVATA